MKLGVEVIAETMVSVEEGSCFETWLAVNDHLIAASHGSDTYLFNGFVIKGKRLAATGRFHRVKLDMDLALSGPMQTRAAVPVEVALAPEDRFSLVFKNNLILDQGLLTAHLALRLIDAQGNLLREIPLRSPAVAIDWRRRGEFVVDLFPFLPDIRVNS